MVTGAAAPATTKPALRGRVVSGAARAATTARSAAVSRVSTGVPPTSAMVSSGATSAGPTATRTAPVPRTNGPASAARAATATASTCAGVVPAAMSVTGSATGSSVPASRAGATRSAAAALSSSRPAVGGDAVTVRPCTAMAPRNGSRSTSRASAVRRCASRSRSTDVRRSTSSPRRSSAVSGDPPSSMTASTVASTSTSTRSREQLGTHLAGDDGQRAARALLREALDRRAHLRPVEPAELGALDRRARGRLAGASGGEPADARQQHPERRTCHQPSAHALPLRSCAPVSSDVRRRCQVAPARSRLQHGSRRSRRRTSLRGHAALGP